MAKATTKARQFRDTTVSDDGFAETINKGNKIMEKKALADFVRDLGIPYEIYFRDGTAFDFGKPLLMAMKKIGHYKGGKPIDQAYIEKMTEDGFMWDMEDAMTDIDVIRSEVKDGVCHVFIDTTAEKLMADYVLPDWNRLYRYEELHK
jgi:hypothetical protein